MKSIYLSIIVTILCLTSCDTKEINTMSDNAVPTATVSVNLETSSNLLKSGYKRGNAPSYIKGVRITANSADYAGSSNEGMFLFAPDGEDIRMTTAVGGVNFKAFGICKYNEFKGRIEIPSEHKVNPSISNTNLRASKYAIVVNNLKQIHANFESDIVNGYVSATRTNSVNLRLKTEDKRLNFIVENESSSIYEVRITLTDDDANYYVGPCDYEQPGTLAAYIINNNRINDVSHINARVELNCLTADYSSDETYTVELTPGKVTTYLLRIKKSGPFTAYSGANITFDEMQNEYDGKQI